MKPGIIGLWLEITAVSVDLKAGRLAAAFIGWYGVQSLNPVTQWHRSVVHPSNPFAD